MEKSAMVDALVQASGLGRPDCTSLLEGTGWNIEECIMMCVESKQVEGTLNSKINVVVHFDEARYDFQFSPQATVEDVKKEVETQTNIVAAQQMLVESASQSELASNLPLETINSTGVITFHLLTENSGV
eukprot:m.267918 g.267918  ORF g.267918 m.267918 type:complete len:130 (+) comp75407_c0_seq1:270-659(+)